MSHKKLLLTGASRGIGHATVKHFHAAGWEIFTASRQNWVDDCPWAEGLLNHIHLDLEDIQSVVETLPLIKHKLGGRWSTTPASLRKGSRENVWAYLSPTMPPG